MRMVSAAVLAAFLMVPAMASDTDTFNVQGTGPDGSTYTATVTVTELHPSGKVAGDVFDVVWDFNGSKIQGVGMVDPANRNLLTVSYVLNGLPGLSIMTQQGGSVTGVWYVQGAPGTGTETWTPASAAAPQSGSSTEITYERAVICSAATSYVTGMLRSTAGADAAKIDAYDKANSAWVIKLGEVGASVDMNKRIDDIQAKQGEWANDPDGLAKATPIADECVATAPPME